MSELKPAELLEHLNWRYATKEFDASRKIPADVWNALEESLVLSPSSFGLQPWHFFTITDAAKREELLPHSWGQKQVTDCSHFVVIASKIETTEADIDQFLKRTVEVRGGDLESLAGYRDLMVGFAQKMDAGQIKNWAKNQTYIALGQLMTSAAHLGVDACPMEGLIPEKYDEILGLSSKGYTTSVACALGYRSASDKYAKAPKVRFEKSELITSL